MAETVIVVDREIMNGTPCFRGTRQFSSVTREMAVQALEEAKVDAAGKDVLDVLRPRQIEQETLDLLDEPSSALL
jgi:hypothetical protein